MTISAATQGVMGYKNIYTVTCVCIFVMKSSPDIVRIDRLKFFLDSMGGGAWPFLVGGVICLVNQDGFGQR